MDLALGRLHLSYTLAMIDSPTVPHVEPLPDWLNASVAFQRLRGLPYCCWLDSALVGDLQSRFSFLAADPIDVLCVERVTADPLAKLERWMHTFQSVSVPGLPPFQGGVGGFLGYELGRCFERVPSAKHNEFGLPLSTLALYDVVLAWDHQSSNGWIISQGFPESTSATARLDRAKNRSKYFQALLGCEGSNASSFSDAPVAHNVHAMAHGLTAPQFETRLGGGWLGNFDSVGFREAVMRAREYIFAGDIFQVNLAQRLLCPARCNSRNLYQKLRQVNAAPFAGYFDIGPAQIISASPERFLQVQDRWIETRPIKGTRRRSHDALLDLATAQELVSSPKDRSENIMIVDLLRNDLSRVSKPDSLRVTQLCNVEAFPYVLHLVSTIRSQLRSDAGQAEVVAALFPGGSITGAPKIRAMEIIAELEPTVRGPYCGSLGYFSCDGNMDWNILIRTLTASRGWWQFQVGGGIVADSVPEQEEEETWTKAAGLVAAINASLVLPYS
ncbi:MAG: anthranilate synthase component I family protein [Pirellula sp.]